MPQPKHLGQRAVASVIALTSRTFFLNLVNFVGAFVLTVFLTPAEFGIFIVTSTIVEILTYFSDVGLAGALIQKKDKLTDQEIEATFTIQQVLVGGGILLALAFSRLIQNFYQLDQVGLWLLYALLAAFFLSSLKTIPSVLSERGLKFDKVVIPQVVEALVFNLLLIVLAWQGWGIKSYIVAVLARAVTGTATIYILVPWRPRLRFALAPVKRLLSFGVPYQANSLLAVFKDKVSLLILGKILGLEGMGILGWAEKWATLPLRYFLDASVKVAFPLFSRLQDDVGRAKMSLERALFFITTTTFPLLAGAYLVMPQLIELIPKYTKWEPGLTTFRLFLISAAIAAVSTFLTNFLTAMGKVVSALGLMVMWTTLTLAAYPFLALQFGYEGVAFGSVAIGLTAFVPYLLVRKLVAFNLLKQVLPALVGSLTMGIVLFLIIPLLPVSLLSLLLTFVIGAIVYVGTLFIISKRALLAEARVFLTYAKK